MKRMHDEKKIRQIEDQAESAAESAAEKVALYKHNCRASYQGNTVDLEWVDTNPDKIEGSGTALLSRYNVAITNNATQVSIASAGGQVYITRIVISYQGYAVITYTQVQYTGVNSYSVVFNRSIRPDTQGGTITNETVQKL